MYVKDRRKDLIISGGENIYPAEVEAVLLAHPEVEEAGVTGVENPQWGQVPVAFVKIIPSGKFEESDLLAFCSQRLARYKLPRHVYQIEQLPRNASRKLLRRKLTDFLP